MSPTIQSKFIAHRVVANRIIRRAKLAIAAVPSLGPQPWALRWRRQIVRPHERAIRTARRALDLIEKHIGPAPALFKPRAFKNAGRMLRLYDPLDTVEFPFRAYDKLHKHRANIARRAQRATLITQP